MLEMKKLLALLMAAVMIFAMAACTSADEDLSGNYQDEDSQRASLVLVKGNYNNYTITIAWANSAMDGEYWIAHADYENGELKYTDGERHVYEYSESGELEKDKVVKKSLKGVLTVKSSEEILWKGAGDGEKGKFLKLELED